jgi:hypothetical protein
VIGAARRTQAIGGCQLGSLGGQLAESDPEARALIAAGFERWAAAISDGLSMQRGTFHPTSIRTTLPPLCSRRSKEGFYSPRYNGTSAHSKPRSIPSSPWPSGDEPKAGLFTAIAGRKHEGHHALLGPSAAIGAGCRSVRDSIGVHNGSRLSCVASASDGYPVTGSSPVSRSKQGNTVANVSTP